MNNKVLLVEDDKNLGKVLTDYLTSKNYLVQLAENGEVGFDSSDECQSRIWRTNFLGISIEKNPKNSRDDR